MAARARRNDYDDYLTEEVIPVYVLTDDVGSKRVQRLNHLFSNSIFDFYPIDTKKTKTVVDSDVKGKTKNVTRNDKEAINASLQHAQKMYPGKTIVIVDDTSKSIIEPLDMAKVCAGVINKGSWDFCYLCTWMDVCEEYVDFHNIPGSRVELVKSQNPNGFQAVMVSSVGQKRLTSLLKKDNSGENVAELISTHVSKGNFTAYRTIPNVINFDMSLAKSNSDLIKANSCKITNNNEQKKDGKSGNGYMVVSSTPGSLSIWIFVIVFVIILIIMVSC